jgi:hypothetical protein
VKSESNFIETYVGQRIPSGKFKISEEELKKSLNIVSSNKVEKKEENLFFDKPLLQPRKKTYSFRSVPAIPVIKKIDSNFKLDIKLLNQENNLLNSKHLHNSSYHPLNENKSINNNSKHNFPPIKSYTSRQFLIQSADLNKIKERRKENQGVSPNLSNQPQPIQPRRLYSNAASQIESAVNPKNSKSENVKVIQGLKFRNGEKSFDNANFYSSSHKDIEKISSFKFHLDVNEKENNRKKNKNNSFGPNPNNNSEMDILDYKISRFKEIKPAHVRILKENLTTTNCKEMKNGGECEKLQVILYNKSRTFSKSTNDFPKQPSIPKEVTRSSNHKFVSKLIDNGSTDKNLINALDKLNHEDFVEKKTRRDIRVKSKPETESNNDRFQFLKMEMTQYKENKKSILHSLSKFQRDSDEYIKNFRKIVNVEKNKLKNLKRSRKMKSSA